MKYELRIRPDLTDLPEVADALDRVAAQEGIDRASLTVVELAVEEALGLIANGHLPAGDGELVAAVFQVADGCLELRLAHPTLAGALPADLDLMASLMDDVSLGDHPGEQILLMRKTLPGRPD